MGEHERPPPGDVCGEVLRLVADLLRGDQIVDPKLQPIGLELRRDAQVGGPADQQEADRERRGMRGPTLRSRGREARAAGIPRNRDDGGRDDPVVHRQPDRST